MEGEQNREYTYDGKFQGSILVVGRTGCGKITFIKKLGKNKNFWRWNNRRFWVSKIILTKEREDFIRESFEDQEVHFSYPHDLDDFNYLVGNFMQDKSEYIDNELGEQLAVRNWLQWTMFPVLLTNLRNFLIFWQYHENMVFPASMYFIQ